MTVEPLIIRQLLAKILRSPQFCRTKRQARFLEFITEQALSKDPPQALTEQAIASHVFGRHDLDPGTNPLVRVAMNELRSRLVAYYAGEGKRDAAIFEITSGYLPHFYSRTEESTPSERPLVLECPAPVSRKLPAASVEESRVVGREPELRRLRGGLDDARAGRGRLIGVAGEPGIGKTAVIEHFLRDLAPSAPVFVARGRSHLELQQGEPYLPWIQALGDLISMNPCLDGFLRTEAPAWWRRVHENGVAGEDQRSPSLNRAMHRFLLAASEKAPVIVFLDDLHWADLASLDLMVYLAPFLCSMPLLIITAYRRSDMVLRGCPFLTVEPELRMHGVLEETTLGELNSASIRTYLDRRFSSNAFSSELIHWLHGRSGGHPLFVVSLVDHCVDQQWITSQGDRWVEKGKPSEWELTVPPTISGMIAKKMGEIRPRQRTLLDACSIHGAEFDSVVIARALGADVEHVEKRLKRLDEVHRLLRPCGKSAVPDGFCACRYRFAHALYQEALLKDLVPAEATRLQLSLAEALIGIYGTSVNAVAANVARLFEAAGENERAVTYYLMAATNAVGQSAYQQAFQLAARAIELVGKIESSAATKQKEMAFLSIQAVAASSLGGFGAAEIEQIYQHSLEISRHVGDEPPILNIAHIYWGFVSNVDYRRAMDIALSLRERADRSHREESMALARLAEGITLLHLGQISASRATLAQANMQWRQQDQQAHFLAFTTDPSVSTLFMFARALCFLGEFDRAEEACTEGLQLARQIGHERTVTYAMALAADIAHLRRDVAGVLRLSEAAEERAREQQLPYDLIWARCLRAWALAQNDQLDPALAIFQSCLSSYRGPTSTKLLCHYAETLGRRGRSAEAGQIVDEAFRVLKQMGEAYYEPELLRVRGELLLQQHAPNEAEVDAAQSLFQGAFATAEKRETKIFALRAALSQCRLSLQFRPACAPEVTHQLRLVYSAISQGRHLPDATEADALLQASPTESCY